MTCRDAMQCREKWINVLDPYLNRGEFTAEEDELLLKMCDDINRNISLETDDTKYWSKIALQFPNRTDNQLYKRWLKLAGQIILINMFNIAYTDI